SVSDASVLNETHSGTRRRDIIVTGFANDLIDTGRGDDLVRAGAGRDTVFGGKGDDRLLGEAGNDMLNGGEGHDRLLGGLGDDVLDGGEGHDRLEGGAGNDLYLHEQHGGDDVIEETGGADALRLGAGITPGMVRLKRRDNDLVLDLKERDGSVTVKGWFAQDSNQVETILFADGTAWGLQDIGDRLKRKKPGTGHGEDHDDGHPHGGRDDDPHGKSDGRKREDRDDDRSERKPERLGDVLEAFLARTPRDDFEALEREFERPVRRSHALDAQEIARRWQAVERYTRGLASEHDDDARHGAAVEWHIARDSLGAGALGGGFGYSGSTGMARGVVNLRTLQGLEEGFQRLRG
ncbi:MAG: calcium-binding protein, partial [Gammaproteobacteria bacterium]